MVTPLTPGIEAAFHGHGGRSQLYVFLWSNYTELSKSYRRPNWQKAAQAANELGIRTRVGRKIKPETMRRTWYRVKVWYRANPLLPIPLPIALSPVTRQPIIQRTAHARSEPSFDHDSVVSEADILKRAFGGS